MFTANEEDCKYRFGDSGPKYLMRGPNIDFGIVRLLPGEAFSNHMHERIEENFFILEGGVSIIVANKILKTLGPGDLIRVDPSEAHYLVNQGSVPMKGIFVKAPFDPNDKVDVELPDEFRALATKGESR